MGELPKAGDWVVVLVSEAEQLGVRCEISGKCVQVHHVDRLDNRLPLATQVGSRPVLDRRWIHKWRPATPDEIAAACMADQEDADALRG